MTTHQTIPGIRERHALEEKRLILGALVRCDWIVTHAARQLGVSQTGLLKLIRRHGLTAEYAECGHGPGPPRLSRQPDSRNTSSPEHSTDQATE